MKTKLNISIVLALLCTLFAIKSNTVHAESITGPPNVQYSAHVANFGWLQYVNTGNAGASPNENKRLEALRIKLNNADYPGDIQYEAYVAGTGWTGAVTNNNIAGTTGRSLAARAIRMQLTGEMANHYDLYYRANVSTMGWLGWAKNNEIAGGPDFDLPMLGYEVKLIRKGDPTPEVKDNYPSYLVNDFDARVENINHKKGTYDVIVDPKTSFPVKHVKIPSWTVANGQEQDLIWHEAIKQSDGTYKYTVKSSEHHYEAGEYISHVYMDLSANIPSVGKPLPSVTFTPKVESKITTDIKNIYIDTSGADPYKLTPNVAVWSDKNGKDDLQWYTGTSIKVPISKHSGYGNYHVEAYYTDQTGNKVLISQKTVKTSENAVNILDENEWFPHHQGLVIYKNSDTSKNKIDVINAPRNATWSSDHRKIIFNPTKDYWHHSYGKYIPKDFQLKATYYNVGEYNGKKIDIVETFKNFQPRDYYHRWFIYAAANFYEGFYIAGSWYSEVDLEFYEAGTDHKIDMNAEDAFVSTNSINRGEYTTYLNSTDNNRIYFTSDSNLIRTNAEDLTTTNNWGIWSNFGYYPPLFGDMQASIGVSENFTDAIGDKTFPRNSAIYRLTGKTHKFIFGTNFSDIWATFSSGVFNEKPPAPEKTLTDESNSKDLTDKKVPQGQTVVYHVKQQVGQLGVSALSKYKTFKLEDKLSKYLQYQKAELYVNDKISNEGTKLIHYDANTNTVTFEASDDFIKNMPLNGETYDLRIYVKGYGTAENPEPIVPNGAIVTIDGHDEPTKTIENEYHNNSLSVTAAHISIDTAPVSKHQFNATINFSQQTSSPDVLETAQYKLIVDEKDADGKQLKEAYSKVINAKDLQSEYKIALPFSTTKKGEKVNYNVRFESMTPDIQFTSNELKTYGVTASERVVSAPTDKISGIVRTTRSKDEDKIKTLSETYKFNYSTSTDAKSGYGVPTDFKLTYSTEAPDLKPNDIDISSPSILQIKTDANLINKDSLVPYTKKDSNAYVDLVKAKTQYDDATKKTITVYQYPQVYSEEKSGEVVLESQRESSKHYKDAGHKMYIPIWASIKPYTLSYVTTTPIGINKFTINVDTALNVYAQMQATYDSKTIKYDELNLLPVLPDEFKKSNEWSDADTKWVKQSSSDDWHGTKYQLIDGKWIKK